jgi:hypothetical protein
MTVGARDSAGRFMCPTCRDAVKEEAAKFGLSLTDNEANDVAWNFTGFPSFWNIPADGATPEECFRTQLKRYFADPKAAHERFEAEMKAANDGDVL